MRASGRIREGSVPNENQQEERAEVDLSEKVFTNSPNMLVLCLTVIGLIKIYTRFEKITTLADNFLAFVCVGYFISTVLLLGAAKPAKAKTAEARENRRRFFWLRYVARALALFMTFAGRLGLRAVHAGLGQKKGKKPAATSPRLRRPVQPRASTSDRVKRPDSKPKNLPRLPAPR
jgi:hypothetical protein